MENYIQVPSLKPIYPANYHRDFREMIRYAADTYGTDDAFILKNKPKSRKEAPTYKHISFRAFRQDVRALGTGLLKSGLGGKRFAIIGKNSYDWIISYYAVLCGLGTCVPLDKGLPYEELHSSLVRSHADVLIFDLGHKDLAEKLIEDGNSGVTTFLCMEDLEGFESCQWMWKKGLRALGDGDTEYDELPIDPDAVTIYLFTSGTTSMSKAVMLSQKNIMSNLYTMEKVEDIRHGDINMAFLPYHHTFGSSGQSLMIACGVTTTFCDGLKYIQKNLVEYHVSVFVCVPLLIEAMYKKIMAGVRKQGKEEKFKKGLAISKLLMKLHIDVRKRLFKDVLDQLGGNVRYIISGASALDPEVVDGFTAMGIQVVQGYGMTESSPVLAAENPKNLRAGSIGMSMPDVELRILEPNEEGIGELIARGDNVMHGYYENPEATAEALVDGWLHTGDLVSCDKDGFLFVRGRKKNVIVLKNGKNVYPEELEILIDALPYVRENIVVGEPRHKDGDSKDLALCARIVYDPDYMKENYGAETQEAIEKVIRADLDKINETLPNYKQILRLDATDQEMEKTTTGKVKRYVQK